MEKHAHTTLQEILQEQKESGTLVVMESKETLNNPAEFMDTMKKVREEYERKSADSVRVLRDTVLLFS